MNAILDGVALWLADFHLVAAALLLGVLAASAMVKQPARRMAVTKATLGALAGLVLLCALPGWSAVHLLSDQTTLLSETNVGRVEAVRAEQSVTHVIPQVNVDQILPPHPDRQAISKSEIAPTFQQNSERTNWVRVALIAHAAGSAMVVAWLMAGAVIARRIRRGAVAASAELQAALQQIAPSNAPRLLASSQVATPVAMGVFDSTIILPSAFNHPAPSPWRGGLGRGLEAGTSFTTPSPHGEGNRRDIMAILAHELAHIRNGDLPSLALSRLLLVLLWPQPLFWWLRRHLRLDQETLADAAAAEVAGRVAYAERLVEWARHQNRGQKAPRLAGAVGLWEGPSQLKRRMSLLLNEKFSVMRSCSRQWRGACFAAMALAAVGLSLVTLQPATQAANDKDKPTTETTKVERDEAAKVAASAPATISGKIVLEDGGPATTKGWLYYESLYYESKSDSSTIIGTVGQFTDKFTVNVMPGTIWLKYWANGFAPAWIGPLEIKSGQVVSDAQLVLKAGRPASVRVVNEAGEPIAGAMLQPLLRINSSTSDPVEKVAADQHGAITLEHLADATYEFIVTAPGYVPLRQEVGVVAPPDGGSRWDEPIQLTIKRSEPTTGVVLHPDGSPAKGAVIGLRVDASAGRAVGCSQPFGDVAATADEEGKFVLDQLAPGHDYLFLVETVDKSRQLMPPIVAGMSNVQIKMPPRRDVNGKVNGDLSKLPERNGKRFVGVRQRVEFKGVNGFQYSDLIGEDVYVTPTDDGGEFTYEGLVDAPIEVTAGETTATFEVADSGVTPITVELGPEPGAATSDTEDAKNEKPSSSSSGGLEAKDWGQRLRYTSPKSSEGWWLVRSAAADADAGRTTLGADVADVGFSAPLDYGDKLKLTSHFAPEGESGPRWNSTPVSRGVK